MKRIFTVVGALILGSSLASAQLFSSAKYTPEVHFDFTGSEPLVTIRTKDGTGQIREIPVDNGEVRFVPGTKFRVYVWTEGVRPSRRSYGGKLTIVRNRVSNAEMAKKPAGVVNGLAQDVPVELSVPGRNEDGTSFTLNRDRNETAPTDPLFSYEDPSLRVLTEGNVYLKATASGKTAEVRLLAAERWDFKDSFEPFFSITEGSSMEFSSLTKFKTLGFNNNLRLDTVAVLTPGVNGQDGEAFLGMGLSYSNFIGSQFKGSGRPFFGFPVRWTMTLGLKGLSIEKRTKGSGTPFFGFGIQIPIGG